MMTYMNVRNCSTPQTLAQEAYAVPLEHLRLNRNLCLKYISFITYVYILFNNLTADQFKIRVYQYTLIYQSIQINIV